MTEKQLRTIEKLDLTINQKTALKQLINYPEGVTACFLGKSIGLKQPTASSWANAALTGLEKRKLVKRIEDNKWAPL